jgi:TolB-like protein/DNA-binding winged helix-turn-helix (wHTH) protein/Flp pilus assembly protein TadD
MPLRQWTASGFSLETGSPRILSKHKALQELILRLRGNKYWGLVKLGFAMRVSEPPTCLRFGVFEVDLRAGQLTKRGLRVRLQEQPFRVLAMLLENPGEVVSREELRSRIWPRTIVDFDHGLNKAINKIREALGDSAENPRFVETVASRGYRFLADVQTVHAPSRQPQTASDVAGDPGVFAASELAAAWKRLPHSPSWRLFGLGLALVLAAALFWIAYSRNHSPATIRSLAVLPLENLSGDPSQDYFAEGMTDELITHLGQIGALRVISRASAMTYKHVRKPLAQIARELNVQAVVEGSVLRSGDRVRITAQLIELPADRHIWAQSYEGDLRDTLSLQNTVARAIAERIRTTLNGQERAALGKSRTVNPDAYEAYLKGRYFWNKRTGDGLKKAIEYFSLAIEKDPIYAEAYSGLADAYALAGDWEYAILSPHEASPKAKAAATKALTLDDSLGEAHTSLAFAMDQYDWDWASAEREYQRAIALNPGYATAHLWYAWHLIVTGRNSQGISELRKAESLDPLSLIISADLADALCIARLYDESVQQSRKTLELDPNFALAHYQLGQAFQQKRMYAEAIAELQKAIELSRGGAVFDSNLAYAYAVSGRRDEALKIAEDLQSQPGQGSAADANIALIYVGLGDNDRAMIWLNKAYQARFNPSILLRPAFDPLRSDARFQDLLRRIGLS